MVASSDKISIPKSRPFRSAVLRGLGIALPPLLTIVLFVWVWSALSGYVLRPIEKGAEELIVWRLTARELVSSAPDQPVLAERDPNGDVVSFTQDGRIYRRLYDGNFIPDAVYKRVLAQPGDLQVATATSRQLYGRYVQIVYLRRAVVVPAFLLVFVLLLYLAGKFVSARLGRMIWRTVELLIERLPIVRKVYSSVKQVTDFMFSERQIEYTRVVALEYPRKRIWSVGFVTGESMLDISSAANEPVVSVLIPTSPMPATGYTITVPRSETIDLNMTIDQAIQYIVSCGVVVPPHQQHETPVQVTTRILGASQRNGQHSKSDASHPALPGDETGK